MGMEQRELLMTVNAIQRVVDIQNDAPWHDCEAVAVQLDHGVHHARKRDPAGQIFQPAHGWLRAEIGAALGQPADRHFVRRVGAQRIAVVGVFVAGRDHQHTEADHLSEVMSDAVGRAWIVQTGCQAFGKAKPPLDLKQHQHPGIRSQTTAVKRNVNCLARDG